jgi:hypothetical protein
MKTYVYLWSIAMIGLHNWGSVLFKVRAGAQKSYK